MTPCKALILCLCLTLAKAEELCGLEPPKEGESCSGAKVEDNTVNTYEYEGKEDEEDQGDVWAMREYKKTKYTNKYDWPIRDQLDAIEDIIADDPEGALERYNELLKKYPESPRIKIAMGLTQDVLINKVSETDYDKKVATRKALVLKMMEIFHELIKDFEDLPKEYLEAHEEDEFLAMEYKIPPTIFGSAVSLVMQRGDSFNETEKAAEILEDAFKAYPAFEKDAERFHLILIQHYMVTLEEDKLLNALKRAREFYPRNLQFAFFEGVSLKMLGRKKEGNAILREMDSDDGTHVEFAHDVSLTGTSMMSRGKHDMAKILYQEASKIHIFLSKFQRPVMPVQDLESMPVWSLKEDEIDVKLTQHDMEFTELESSYKTIVAEAEKAMEDMADGSWLSEQRTTSDTTTVTSKNANILAFPLHMYGRKKMMSCDTAKTTCTVLKELFHAATSCKVCTSKFLVLEPGLTTTEWCSPTNARLRLYLPLKNGAGFKMTIGKGEQVDFEDGKLTVVDESFQHSMRNPTSEPVVLLAIDFAHPNLAQGSSPQKFTDVGQQLFAVL